MTCDSTATCRWALNITLPDVPVGFDSLGSRIRVRRGLHIPRVGEYLIPWGIHRVNQISEASDGVTVDATSFEKQIEDARFPRARRIGGAASVDQGSLTSSTVPGSTYREVIKALVLEAVPDTTFDFRTSAVDQMVRPFIAEKDRWTLLDGGDQDTSIAAALGVEMFFDGQGVFVVQDQPTISGPVDWDTDDSSRVVTSLSKEQNRDGLYNVVVASGQSTTGEAPVGPGYAWDNSVTSRTYAGPDPINHPELASDFGVIPMFLTSGFLNNQSQCNTAAASLLQKALGIKRTMSFNQIANYALEPGDVITNGGLRHLVQSWSCSLRDEDMSCATRATKDDLSDIDISTDTTT